MSDLLRRFPAHRAWTEDLPCGPSVTTTLTGVRRPAAITPATVAVDGAPAGEYAFSLAR